MAAQPFTTELALAKYMHDLLSQGNLAGQLNLDPDLGHYGEPVDEALLAVGVSDVATVTGTQGLRQLRAAARVELWRMVMGRTAGKHQRGLGDTARSEHQIFDHAKEMFGQAMKDARRLGIASYRVTEAPQGSSKIDYAQGYYGGRSNG
jgi:hypothetical protein